MEENIRMCRVGFFKLYDMLHLYIEYLVTIMRTPVYVKTQIAITLYYLSVEGRLRKVGNVFGLCRAYCSIIVPRVSSAITTHLGPLYIKLPINEDSVKGSH